MSSKINSEDLTLVQAAGALFMEVISPSKQSQKSSQFKPQQMPNSILSTDEIKKAKKLLIDSFNVFARKLRCQKLAYDDVVFDIHLEKLFHGIYPSLYEFMRTKEGKMEFDCEIWMCNKFNAPIFKIVNMNMKKQIWRDKATCIVNLKYKEVSPKRPNDKPELQGFSIPM